MSKAILIKVIMKKDLVLGTFIPAAALPKYTLVEIEIESV